jgi:hypothetical protein
MRQNIYHTIPTEDQIRKIEFALAKYGSYLDNGKLRDLVKAIYVNLNDLSRDVVISRDVLTTPEEGVALYNALAQIQAFEIILAAANLFNSLAKNPLAAKVINATYIQYLTSVEQGMLEFLYNHGCSDQLGLDFVMGYAENPEHPIKLHGATLAKVSELILEQNPIKPQVMLDELKRYNWFKIQEEDVIACPHDRPTFGLTGLTGPTGGTTSWDATAPTAGNRETQLYLAGIVPTTFDQAQAVAYEHPEIVHVETDPEALRAQIALLQNIGAQEIQPVQMLTPEEKKENASSENYPPTFFEVLAAKAAIEQQG